MDFWPHPPTQSPTHPPTRPTTAARPAHPPANPTTTARPPTACPSDVFAAGASHYGVADLELLAKETHKFESRYLDNLIAPYPAVGRGGGKDSRHSSRHSSEGGRARRAVARRERHQQLRVRELCTVYLPCTQKEHGRMLRTWFHRAPLSCPHPTTPPRCRAWRCTRSGRPSSIWTSSARPQRSSRCAAPAAPATVQP